MFLSVTTQDKIALWEKIKLFWYEEGFGILSEDITISTLQTRTPGPKEAQLVQFRELWEDTYLYLYHLKLEIVTAHV